MSTKFESLAEMLAEPGASIPQASSHACKLGLQASASSKNAPQASASISLQASASISPEVQASASIRQGSAGGRARAGVLTTERRSEIARRAARKRWAKKRQIGFARADGMPD